MYTEIGLRDLLSALIRGRRFIAVITLAAVVLGVAYACLIYTPTYQASTLVDLLPYWVGPGHNDSAIFAGKGQTQTFLRQCLSRAEKENIPAEALSGLSFIEVKNTTLVEVRASYHDRDLASRASRLAGEELLVLAHQQTMDSLELEIREARLSLQQLDLEIESYRLENSLPPGAINSGAEEPYLRLLEARSDLLYELSTAAGQRERLAGNPAPTSAPWISEGNIASPRVAVYRMVFVVAALILGLLVSCFMVFLRYYWYDMNSNEINS